MIILLLSASRVCCYACLLVVNGYVVAASLSRLLAGPAMTASLSRLLAGYIVVAATQLAG
jgi:hypothetical protein